MDKTIAILEQARNVFRGGNAWTRGIYHDTRCDRYCLVGGIRQAVLDLELEGRSSRHTQPVYRLLAKQIRPTHVPPGVEKTPMWRVIRFNDSRLSYSQIDELIKTAINERQEAIAGQRVQVAEHDLSVSGD